MKKHISEKKNNDVFAFVDIFYISSINNCHLSISGATVYVSLKLINKVRNCSHLS